MTIRTLTAEDSAPYQELRLRALREEPVAFLSSPADEEGRALAEIEARVTPAGDGSKSVFGAFTPDSGQLVGTVTFIRQMREKARHAAELCGMYVAPAWRRAGTGGALLDAALAHARALPGLRQVKLGVSASNIAARALYQARGFRRYGAEPDAVFVEGAFHDEELYLLRLTES